MGEAVGQLLPLAAVVALSPPPIIAVVVMLIGERGRVTAPVFLAGWILGLVAIGLVVLSAASLGDAGEAGRRPRRWRLGNSPWASRMLAFAVRGWRRRSDEGGEKPTPKWMEALEGLTAAKAAGLGLALSALNPKNIVLTIAAGAAIAQTGIPATEQAIAYAGFIVVASLGVATPVVLSAVLGERSREPLDRISGWMTANNTAVMAVLLLVIGVMLIGDAISGQ